MSITCYKSDCNSILGASSCGTRRTLHGADYLGSYVIDVNVTDGCTRINDVPMICP